MATRVLRDAKLWIGGYNLSADHNQLAVDDSVDAVEDTAFGAGSHTYKPGLTSVTVDHNGWFDADSAVPEVDDRLWAEHIGGVLTVMTYASAGAAGDPAYSFNAVQATYSPLSGAVGEMAAFSANAQGSGAAFRGTVMEPGVTARSSSSQSAGYQLGDLAAGETGYGALHVIATTGTPTIDVVIQSDTSGFPSPTTRLTFAQLGARGAQFLSTTTTTTDDWWRASWTFGGSGSITFVVNFGIQTT
jgi:hypothetical protein